MKIDGIDHHRAATFLPERCCFLFILHHIGYHVLRCYSIEELNDWPTFEKMACCHFDSCLSTIKQTQWQQVQPTTYLPQRVVQGLKNRKWHTYDVIKGHWTRNQMTSVDLGKFTMLVLIMDVTSQHLFMCILPVKMLKFASYRRQNVTESKFRLTRPWISGHRSKVIVGTALTFLEKM